MYYGTQNLWSLVASDRELFNTVTCPSLLWFRIPTGTLDSFMWGSCPASLQNVSGSTQVPVCAWNNAWKNIWGLPPPVKLERRHATYSESVWHYTQSNKQTNIVIYVGQSEIGSYMTGSRLNQYVTMTSLTVIIWTISTIRTSLLALYREVFPVRGFSCGCL
jgi:hypothetical protein